MSATAVRGAVAAPTAACDALAEYDVDALTAQETLSALDELEELSCRMPVQWHRMLARLQIETTTHAMGARSWRDLLATRWPLSGGEASRRLAEAAELGPRPTLSGAPLEPKLPAVAAAGAITSEHVKVLRNTMFELPA